MGKNDKKTKKYYPILSYILKNCIIPAEANENIKENRKEKNKSLKRKFYSGESKTYKKTKKTIK